MKKKPRLRFWWA